MLFVSSPGDYIGQGQTHVTTNEAEFSAQGSPGGLVIGAFGYLFIFDPPEGSNFVIGLYPNATRWPFNGSGPGLSIDGNGRGCNTLAGEFEIFELHTNAAGGLDRLWLVFTQRCEIFGPPLIGEIRYHSQLAPPAPVPRTLRVPTDYPTIQSAIDAASLLAFDTVLVLPGTYPERLQLRGRPVRLVSEAGPAATLIASPNGDATITSGGGETPETVVSGFTISNGGFTVVFSAPTIASNHFVNCGVSVLTHFASPVVQGNRFAGCGGAVYLGGSSTPLIEGNVMEESTAAGISMFAAGSPIIRNNLIRNNHGNGMDMVNECNVEILQNVIVNNGGSGIAYSVPSGSRGPYISHNTIVGNGGPDGYQIAATGFDTSVEIVNNILVGARGLPNITPILRFNNVYATKGPLYGEGLPDLTGTNGNISAPPQFLFPEDGYFQLLAGSPGIDAGSTNGSLPFDFEGVMRPVDGNGDGITLPDMGAFEFTPGPPRPATILTAISQPEQTLLSWRPFDGATSYVLRRSTNVAGPYSNLVTTTNSQFADTNFAGGVIYYFTVAGSNSFGIGSNSTPVAIRAGNHPPLAGTNSVTIQEDTVVLLTVLTNNVDGDGDALSIELIGVPLNGFATLTSSNTIVFEPFANFAGTNLVGFRIFDIFGAAGTGGVTVITWPVNDAPVALGISMGIMPNQNNSNAIQAVDIDSATSLFVSHHTPQRV